MFFISPKSRKKKSRWKYDTSEIEDNREQKEKESGMYHEKVDGAFLCTRDREQGEESREKKHVLLRTTGKGRTTERQRLKKKWEVRKKKWKWESRREIKWGRKERKHGWRETIRAWESREARQENTSIQNTMWREKENVCKKVERALQRSHLRCRCQQDRRQVL